MFQWIRLSCDIPVWEKSREGRNAAAKRNLPDPFEIEKVPLQDCFTGLSPSRFAVLMSRDQELTRILRDPYVDMYEQDSGWPGPDDRSMAKEINFAICYGMSVVSLVRKINEVKKKQRQPFIEQAKAQEYTKGFYREHPGISEFFERKWDRLKKLPLKERVVTNRIGRIRKSGTRANPAVQRQFRVSLPQMMEADILKTAAIQLDQIFRRRGLASRIVMLIDDAIWVEAPAKEEKEARRLMNKIMATAGRPFLEMKVDFSD